ncbi:MAG: Rpn family recombination-promoting nuclease/putative transposase [Lachnospiraceae bacterium]|nr:Rpn family recombination-promoting nuclease/putative transposase [Lachnospiraceae bacterium]
MTKEKYKKKAAEWDKLTITSRFIFYRVMRDNEDLCLELLQRILPELKIKGLKPLVAEKVIEETLDGHAVRLDVYVEENGEPRVYNIEMQAEDTLELRHRSRYYQSMVDSETLDKGANYTDLPNSYVIFICPFDLFEKGLHRYTFTYRCREVDGLQLGEGTCRIFLNAKSMRKDVSEPLQAFLDYCMGRPVTDSFVTRLDEAVKVVKRDKEARRRYMYLKEMVWEEGEKVRRELGGTISMLENENGELKNKNSELETENARLRTLLAERGIEYSSNAGEESS